MARGREDKGGKQKASTSTAEGLEIASLVSEKEAEGLEMASLVSEGKGKKPLQTKSEEETSSESETDEEYLETDDDDDDDDVDDDYEDDYFVEGRFCNGLAAQLGNGGDINVLFETPSGFAIFGYDGIKLLKPNAMQDIWADFVTEYVAKRVVVLKEFKTFEDKLAAINHETGVSEALATMIQQYTAPLQKLAVGNDNYRDIIEKCLHIPCMSGPHVDELMWGLKIQMRCLVPGENSELIKEDRFPMSAGMTFLLNRHNFKVQPDMLVTKVIIEKAGFVFECDRCVNKHNDSLRSAAEHLKKISDIDTQSWDLMKLAAAFKMICFPEEKFEPAKWLFTRRQLKRLRDDAPKYKDRILKMPCLVVYNEMSWARELRFKMARVLLRLVKRAKEAYEAEKACEAASDHEICPDGKGIHPGTTPVIIDELTECVRDIILSAGRKERQVPPTQAPIIALERYTQISSHPLHRVNEPGILSMDIHSSKDIVATGGVDTNVVLFDRPSGQILCTLTGHSKKITSLKFVNQDELLLTGSADKTVRVWQGSEDRTYSCIHTLKNHTAEVEAVTVNSTQKHFVTASKDNSWCLYDISTGSCLAQVGKGSGQEGYTSASFHPDGLILGTGTTDAIVKLWDFRASNVVKMVGHVGPVTAMSFSNNGYFLATAALDGVKLWDIRKLRNFMTLSPYDSDTPTNAVEFDFTGSYLAVGGSDIRVYQVPNFMAEWNVTKTLPDLSGTGEVTCVKFGADATYIAVGSMDPNLRIFGIQSCQLAGRETTFC